MGTHARDRRAWAATLGAAAAIPLAGGTVVLLADALGGVVEVPGDAVRYMALTGVVLTCAVLPLILWSARRLPQPGLAAVAGGLTALTIAAAGLVPVVPVFASAMMLAGMLAGPLLVLPRVFAARVGAFASWHAAALTGLVAAALLATTRAGSPGTALAIAGVAAALLGVAAICSPPEGTREVARLRDVAGVVRPALPAYAMAGLAISVAVMAGLHLLLFRWNLVGADSVERLAWAALPAPVLVVIARSVRTIPWLLLASATAPVLMATAPGPVTLALGFTVALTACALAAAALDRAVLRPLPDAERPAAAGLTGVAAVAGGLLGLVCIALLRKVAGDGSALTLMALPTAFGALLSVRVRTPPPEAAPSPSLADHLRERARMQSLPDPDQVAAAALDVFPGLRSLSGEPVAALPEPQRRLLGLAEALITLQTDRGGHRS